ncbi:carbon-nitrogen hydrolase family protein [Glutamicibacter sp. FBE19]|uniref:carbon-nitrogen hydrolase family protein n=1 Tax=Glutamicibacter sp. FBE19 TaxID=2761534 RepID=UPI001896525F|nr:carbon-nitrogen hydrolase family protein [Glutamicibacter sp. FBE19]MBF6673538.1 carbon-nitrogen hydrolase family protein [Glutamicibacter sp. FBE19]
MRIAVMQGEAEVLGIERNLDAIDQAAQRAAGDGAKILLTSELFAVGYAPYVLRDSLDVSLLPSAHERLSRIAAMHSIALVYSLPEITDDGWLITSTFLDDRGVKRAHYQKVQLFGAEEHEVFIAGSNPPASFDYKGMTLGMVICFDVEFPEVVRAAARRSVQLLLVPTAMGRGYEQVCTRLVPTRAMESQLFIAYANHCGSEAGFDLAGTSVIAGADGAVLAQAGSGAELLAAEIDVSSLAQIRAEVPYLSEARRDLYAQWQSAE